MNEYKKRELKKEKYQVHRLKQRPKQELEQSRYKRIKRKETRHMRQK